MSKFEFIMMFVSVVVAFAVGELLVGWGKIIRARARVSRPLLMAGWSVWLLFIMTFHYLGFWEYQAYDFVRVGPMVLFVSAPIMLVLLTYAFTPEMWYYEVLDLEAHYFRNKNWFFVGLFLFLFLAQAANALLPGYFENWFARTWGTLLIAATILPLPFTENRAVHYSVMTINLVYIVVIGTMLQVPGL